MGKPRFTKGPWHIVPYGDGNALVICTEPDGNWRICFLATPGDSSGAWETIKADANLIAAAPEMFDALKALLRCPEIADCDPRDKDEETQIAERMARAALLKASPGGTKDAG